MNKIRKTNSRSSSPASVKTISGEKAFISSRADGRRPARDDKKKIVNKPSNVNNHKNEPRFTAQKTNGLNTKFFIEPKLRVIGLGGLEETGGKNVTVLEYKNDIIIIDMGLMFPDSDMPGVDYVIPDVTYLEKNKKKIRALIVTHGHLDHIGAIPYVYEKLGSPPIYSAPLSIGIIKGRLEEFGLDRGAKLHPIKIGEDKLKFGVLK